MTYVPKTTKLKLEAKQQLHNDVEQHSFIICLYTSICGSPFEISKKQFHKATKADNNTTVLGVRWCGWRPYNSRKERKKLLAGRPRPRRQCERKTTRSPS